MKGKPIVLLAFLICPELVLSQTDDAAAERAQLAKQRIQAEMAPGTRRTTAVRGSGTRGRGPG